MSNKVIDRNMYIGEILREDTDLAKILLESGMHCLGCPSSQMETLEEACAVHGINVDVLEEKLNKSLENK